jgi:hypothetical protein
MKWIGISGSRLAEPETKVEEDVRSEVRKVFIEGNGIVSGGALGVDWFAVDEWLKLDPVATKVKIFLPVTLEKYASHYRKRAEKGVITARQAEDLIAQLTKLKEINAKALIENTVNKVVDTDSYYARNTEIVSASDELLAFRITRGGGTQDTINKARNRRIPVRELTY